MSDQDPPKLIVDDDWKSEAKREKERLSTAASEPKDAPAPGAPGAEPEPIGIRDLIRTFASQAAMYLGLIPEPQSKQRLFAPELARLNIDFLAVLDDKTKGNLTDEESQELTQTLSELRALFVETTKAVAKAMEEGKIPTEGAAPPDLRTPSE